MSHWETMAERADVFLSFQLKGNAEESFIVLFVTYNLSGVICKTITAFLMLRCQ